MSESRIVTTHSFSTQVLTVTCLRGGAGHWNSIIYYSNSSQHNSRGGVGLKIQHPPPARPLKQVTVMTCVLNECVVRTCLFYFWRCKGTSWFRLHDKGCFPTISHMVGVINPTLISIHSEKGDIAQVCCSEKRLRKHMLLLCSFTNVPFYWCYT